MTAPRLIVLLVLAVLPLSMGQVAERTAGEDEFPALQLLPPGSVVEGISLPRYEEHRVTAFLSLRPRWRRYNLCAADGSKIRLPHQVDALPHPARGSAPPPIHRARYKRHLQQRLPLRTRQGTGLHHLPTQRRHQREISNATCLRLPCAVYPPAFEFF